MRHVFFYRVYATIPAPIECVIWCEKKFDALEEMRVSSFDSAASAPTRMLCFEAAKNFLKNSGEPPHGCAGAKALIRNWSDGGICNYKKLGLPDFKNKVHKTTI